MIKTIPIDQLQPHPDNPRLALRVDTVDAIANQIRDKGFEERHAPHVRESGDGYEIISARQQRGWLAWMQSLASSLR